MQIFFSNVAFMHTGSQHTLFPSNGERSGVGMYASSSTWFGFSLGNEKIKYV